MKTKGFLEGSAYSSSGNAFLKCPFILRFVAAIIAMALSMPPPVNALENTSSHVSLDWAETIQLDLLSEFEDAGFEFEHTGDSETLWIDSIKEGNLFHKIGLRKGDKVVSINKKIPNRINFMVLLARSFQKERIEIEVERPIKERRTRITFDARPEWKPSLSLYSLITPEGATKIQRNMDIVNLILEFSTLSGESVATAHDLQKKASLSRNLSSDEAIRLVNLIDRGIEKIDLEKISSEPGRELISSMISIAISGRRKHTEELENH